MAGHAENDTEALLVREDQGEVTSTRRHWRIVAALVCVCVVGLIGVSNLPKQSSGPAVHGANSYDFTELVAENADEFEKEVFENDGGASFPIYTDQNSLAARSFGPRQAKQWVIIFPEGADADKVTEVAGTLGDKAVYTGTSSSFIVVQGTIKELREMLKDIEEPIEFVEQDVKSIATPEQGESRRLGQASWGIDRVDERNLPLDKKYEAMGEGEGAHVYVFDTGVNVAHQDFEGRAIPTLEVLGRNVKVCDAADNSCANDVQGHGTHCAGTVGGASFGVAKKATIHAVKILADNGEGSFSWFEMAMDWLIQNKETPAIVSASLGGRGQVQSTLRMVDYAIKSGITVVVAAGNENSDACKFTPAYIPSAITVGSTDREDERSGFSNHGNCLDIFAPGSAIVSAGLGSSDSTTLSGTSMACPHVSGAAALFLIADPSLSPKQLVQRMTEHATVDIVKHHGDGSPDKLLFVGDGDDEPPVYTPAPAPDGDTCQSLGWEVAEGDCTIDDDCCLTSPNYPEAYGSSQNCVVKVGSDPGPIDEKHFETEGWWDSLSFMLAHDGVKHFTGRTGPHDEVPWGDIHWHADDSIQKSGFKLCLPHRGQCPENGWMPPSHCQATFTYQDTEYSGCTTKDHYGGWCQVSRQDGWLRWADCVQCKPDSE